MSRSGRSTACRSRSRTISRRRGDPKPVGTAAEDMTPQKADAPPAQRLREAGAIIFTKTTMPDYGMLSSGLSSFHPLDAQSVEARPQSRRLVGGGGRGGCGALWPAAPWHRHRRLGAAAGWLVRHFRPQAERRTDPDRSALHRPRGRPDDARRRRRRADDGDACRCPTSATTRASNTRSWTGSSSLRRSRACASACCWRRAAARRRRPKSRPPSSAPRRISRRRARMSSRSSRS